MLLGNPILHHTLVSPPRKMQEKNLTAVSGQAGSNADYQHLAVVTEQSQVPLTDLELDLTGSGSPPRAPAILLHLELQPWSGKRKNREDNDAVGYESPFVPTTRSPVCGLGLL